MLDAPRAADVLTDVATPTVADFVPAVEAPPVAAPAPGWSLATRLAFRFFCVYFTLYVFTTQMLPGMLRLPVGGVPNFGYLPPVTTIVDWVASRIFGATLPLVRISGSGDKTSDWVLASILIVVTLALTALWSIVHRRRLAHVRAHMWFRLFLRFAIGSTLISYGSVKAIPLQMPAPSLQRLLEPFGHFSPMGVLWASIGASPSYEIFTGCVELTAGVLLMLPQTVTLGALLALAATGQIFALNMTYDVPVKLFSFHLILMSLFLLAPDARRLVNVLLLNRIAGPSIVPPIGRTPRRMRIAVALQVLFATYLVGMAMYSAVQGWSMRGGGAARSPFYGIWTVEHMAIDGVTRAPLVTDYDRFRRAFFDGPTAMGFQRMDETFVRYFVKIDTAGGTIALTRPNDPKWKGEMSFVRPAEDRLTLTGELDGKKLRMDLALVDRNNFLLVTRGFNWVQELPFNR